MAGTTFNLNYMSKVSSSANSQGLNVWSYNGKATANASTVAQISDSGFFNPFMQSLTTGNGPLQVGDTIIVSGSDANGMYKVTAVTTNVTVSAFAAADPIDTANLVDGAVTAGKLATDAVETAKILDANVTSSKLAPTVLQYATATLTAAQFNGMFAAPRALVAAPGANKIIVLNRCDLLMTYVGANYAAGGVVAVQYDNTAEGAGVIASTTLSAATFQAAASTGFIFNTGVVPQTFSTCVNKGLFLSNVTQAFTTGDSTFVAHIWYSIVSTV
jgi:hypothetical protein